MQPIAHQFEIVYFGDAPAAKVTAHGVSEAGDWLHFTDAAGQMVHMAQKAATRSVHRLGPVEQPEPAEDVAA